MNERSKEQKRRLPGDGPVVKTSSAGGVGSVPGWGTKIPHVVLHGQN